MSAKDEHMHVRNIIYRYTSSINECLWPPKDMYKSIRSSTILNRPKVEITQISIHHKIYDLTYNGILYRSENKTTHNNMIDSHKHSVELRKLGTRKSYSMILFIHKVFKMAEPSCGVESQYSSHLTGRREGVVFERKHERGPFGCW